MPLVKKSTAVVAPQPEAMAIEAPKPIEAVKAALKKATNDAPITKDDYWRRREERDVQRDKDMAWSGLAQAALTSVGLVQLNATNTAEGLVDVVVQVTELLLAARDKRNS